MHQDGSTSLGSPDSFERLAASLNPTAVRGVAGEPWREPRCTSDSARQPEPSRPELRESISGITKGTERVQWRSYGRGTAAGGGGLLTPSPYPAYRQAALRAHSRPGGAQWLSGVSIRDSLGWGCRLWTCSAVRDVALALVRAVLLSITGRLSHTSPARCRPAHGEEDRQQIAAAVDQGRLTSEVQSGADHAEVVQPDARVPRRLSPRQHTLLRQTRCHRTGGHCGQHGFVGRRAQVLSDRRLGWGRTRA
jgi:hypothetical protein